MVGLVELENDDTDTAIADLAAGLNAITGASTKGRIQKCAKLEKPGAASGGKATAHKKKKR